MAYLIFSRRNVEVGRFPLAGPVVIGRSPDCDISVHDILLSRRHCRLDPVRGGWVAIDLNSKNGTKIGDERITRLGLRDGDVLTAGRTTIRFRLGKLAAETADVVDHPGNSAAPAESVRGVTFGKRPADPFEALAGTVCAFDAEAAMAAQRRLKLPTPKPKPREPAAYVRDDLYSMLTEIASSSWDSIYAGASRPLPERPLPRVAGPVVGRVEPSADAATFQRLSARRPARPASPRAHAGAGIGRGAVRSTVPAGVSVGSAPGSPGRIRAVVRRVGRLFERARRWFAPPGAVRLL